MENISNTFGAKLKKLRLSHHFSQEELASALSIPRATLALYEAGTRKLPRKERLNKIAKYFNVSIDYLIGDNQYNYENIEFEQQIINILKESTIHFDNNYSYSTEEKEKIIEILIGLAKMSNEERKIALDLLIRMSKN